MAMICHLLVFSFFIIPMGNLIGPLVLWLIKKDTMPFVDDQGKEVLNFQITFSILCVICLLTFWLFFIPVLIAIAASIAVLVFTIIGAIKANEGVAYRFPFTLRLIK